MPREVFLDLSMTRHGLRHLGRRILIPVMPAAMTDEDTAKFFNLPDEIPMLHATSSFAW